MSAKETVRRIKTDIQTTLCGDYILILNEVYKNGIITLRDYNNIKSINKASDEERVIELVDKIMNKGEPSCQSFLSLLETDQGIKDTFPGLQSILRNATLLISEPVQASSSQRDEMQPDRERQNQFYQLESQPVGLCVIINNENFSDRTQRRGTEEDARSLAEVFSWLRFRVLMCKDQTKREMEETMECFASLTDFGQLQRFNVQEWSDNGFVALQPKQAPPHGDAFICCILSHGQKGAVLGTDGKPVSIMQIRRTFKGSEQSPLTGKPKVFLIQACQGSVIQRGVLFGDLEADDSGSQSIPVDADFLVAVATVEDHVSFRHCTNGSWFVQSLCQQLWKCCPRGEDLTTILHYVNDEVSQREASGVPGSAKQMPEFKVTLRKRLVLSPHH